MTTELFMLRAVQVGLRISDLDLLDYGMVLNMLSENNKDYDNAINNNGDNSVRDANQTDFDKF
jgi:hypothetical protein